MYDDDDLDLDDDLGERPPLIYAHEAADDRPLDSRTLLCACKRCQAAIERTAAQRPRFVLGLKTGCDRLLVTAEYLVEVKKSDASLRSLLYVEGDYVRDIFVPSAGPYLWRQRWWSLTFEEDCAAIGRKHPKSKVARRESQAARRRRHERWAAEDAAREADRIRRGLPPPQPIVFTPLAEAVAPVRAQYREVITAAAEWALSRGRSIDRDLLALVIAGTGGKMRFRRTDIGSRISCAIHNWGTRHRVFPPDGLPTTLWLWLNFLAESGRLDPESDPLPALLGPFGCMGLDENGEEAAGDRVVDCECFVEYVGPSHGEVEFLEPDPRARLTPS